MAKPVKVGDIQAIEVTPTVTAGAYSANDFVGGKMTFSNAVSLGGQGEFGGGGVSVSAVVTDEGKQNAALTLVLFDADPTGTTVTDNGAATVADADLAKIIGTVSLSTYVSFADNSVTSSGALGLPFKLALSANDLYGFLMTTGTPTYTSTSDIVVKLGILQNDRG